VRLLDECCPSKYYWILLAGNITSSLAQLKFWSLFEPEDKRIPFMVEDNPLRTFAFYLFCTAEGNSQLVDSYNQAVNLGQYNPNYMRIEQDFVRSFDPDSTTSNEEKEINYVINSKMKSNKASFEAWEHKLINSYRYLKAQANNNIMSDMERYLWDEFIGRLALENTSRMYGKGKAEQVQSHIEREGKRSLRLNRLKIWRDNNKQKYKDMVSLCKLGIPKELRPTIWSELFGFSGVRDSDFEKNKIPEYEKYIRESIGNDCIVYRQIEQDVMDMAPLNNSNKEEFENKEKPLILKIAKAFYAWCLEKNSEKKHSGPEKDSEKKDNKSPKKDKEDSLEKGKYTYFKGVLYLIQKVSQVFDEVEIFWCVVGFANALPYLFKSQEVMTAGLTWNHKLLLLAITTIMEKKYPKIYEAIIKHGLPIEYYISDKVFTILSTVFNTEALLSFYDIIALEAGSKEPIRAMWVILTGCVMLMKLNETYIIPARSAEEIALIINNTGINRLNRQKIIEELYNLNNELFTTYNPIWDKILMLVTNDKSSAIGINHELMSKANKLEAHYKSARELTKQTKQIIKEIRDLIPGSKRDIDDGYWMKNFVRRFCKYYGDAAKKEVPEDVHIYIHKCYNIPNNVRELELSSSDDMREINIEEDGNVNSIETFGYQEGMTLTLTVGGSDSCTIDLSNYEANTPITIDFPLNPKKESGKPSTPQKPQMFVSLVLLLVTKGYEGISEDYKRMKDCMLHKSTIVTSLKGANKETNAVEKFKQNLKSKLMNAGMVSAYVPGAKILSLTESNMPTKENDIKALLHMFSLVKHENVSYVQSEMPDAEPEVKELAEKVYKQFSKHYGGRLPLKRVVVSLIAGSSLTVNKKLSYFYKLYTSFTGTGNLEEGQNCFLLDDIIELIQLLCELYLVYIPPEDIPHLTEQIMTKGGINRITRSYLVSANISTPEKITNVLMNKNLKKEGDTADAIDVTRQVQAAFADHWETWGHKQLFTEDSSSFCLNLKEILKGFSTRPKNNGPYRLIICYRHNGENFYKVLDYDRKERLKAIEETKEEGERSGVTNFLVFCKNNFSFVGEKIKMSEDEFLYRMKKFPVLTELMRLHLGSSATELVAKKSTNCKVKITKGDERIVVVDFTEDNKNEEQKGPKYDFRETENTKTTLSTIRTTRRICKDCFAIDFKERIIEVIKEAIRDINENYAYVNIPKELDLKNLNHSLQLFCDGELKDDFADLSLDVTSLFNTYSHILN